METLNEYPKVTKEFLLDTINRMYDKEDWQRRIKWMKNKYKWIK